MSNPICEIFPDDPSCVAPVDDEPVDDVVVDDEAEEEVEEEVEDMEGEEKMEEKGEGSWENARKFMDLQKGNSIHTFSANIWFMLSALGTATLGFMRAFRWALPEDYTKY
jgi:hypothetical protein